MSYGDQRGAEAQGWGLSILLHMVIGVPFLGAMIMLTPASPDALVMPFRWEVSIVSVTPASVVTAALLNSIAPAHPTALGGQPPTEGDSQASDPGPKQALVVSEQPAEHPPTTGPAGDGQEQRHRATDERPIAKTGRFSTPFADNGVSGPPLPDSSPRFENRLRVRATMARPAVMQRPHPIERRAHRRSTLPDYGWLSVALREKIERTKRYPHLARANRWQGQVLVQFCVRQDGHLVDPRVAESSGHLVLDQAALETVREASPVALQHRLEQPLVAVSLPLTYQLE
jgi:protein TonB